MPRDANIDLPSDWNKEGREKLVVANQKLYWLQFPPRKDPFSKDPRIKCATKLGQTWLCKDPKHCPWPIEREVLWTTSPMRASFIFDSMKHVSRLHSGREWKGDFRLTRDKDHTHGTHRIRLGGSSISFFFPYSKTYVSFEKFVSELYPEEREEFLKHKEWLTYYHPYKSPRLT